MSPTLRPALPALLAACLLAGCAAAGNASPGDGAAVAADAAGALATRGTVTKVVDGDTIDVELPGGSVQRVRLLGIDTPEVHGRIECGGPEASAWTKRFLPVGAGVELVADPSQSLEDQYGRQLRYVTKVSTGADVNRRIVAKGWARLFVWHDDPFQRVASYRSALRHAKAENRGVWGLC
jgi:endonuclease YncB( thermonuclease family)